MENFQAFRHLIVVVKVKSFVKGENRFQSIQELFGEFSNYCCRLLKLASFFDSPFCWSNGLLFTLQLCNCLTLLGIVKKVRNNVFLLFAKQMLWLVQGSNKIEFYSLEQRQRSFGKIVWYQDIKMETISVKIYLTTLPE